MVPQVRSRGKGKRHHMISPDTTQMMMLTQAASTSRPQSNQLSPKEVALVKRDPQDLNCFEGLTADFWPRFLAVTQNRYGSLAERMARDDVKRQPCWTESLLRL